MAEISW